jgi:hypothetical protein
LRCSGERCPQITIDRLVVLRASTATQPGQRLHRYTCCQPEQSIPDQAMCDTCFCRDRLRCGWGFLMEGQDYFDSLLVPEEGG